MADLNQPVNNVPAPGEPGQPAPVNNAGAYSGEYVKSLRDEAAAWRSKLRDTESTLATVQGEVAQIKLDATVGTELKKRNLNVDASWIKIGEGQSVEQAVEKFVKDYPQMATETGPQNAAPQTYGTQKPMGTEKPNTNNNGVQATELQAVRKDPVARARLRDQYRSMLTEQHKGTTI